MGGTDHVNEVRLLGRLAAAPVRRTLPSGTEILTFRLVVERDRRTRQAAQAASRRSPTVDTLDCAAWRKDTQRVLSRVEPGDLLEIHGALRRRFWRSPAGPTSRSEVEVGHVRPTRRSRTPSATMSRAP